MHVKGDEAKTADLKGGRYEGNSTAKAPA